MHGLQNATQPKGARPAHLFHKGHTGALYSKNSDPAAKVGMELFTTTLDLYGGVLWSGELQGFIIQQMMPTGIQLGLGPGLHTPHATRHMHRGRNMTQ
jgi:hypothetical protein